MADVTRLERDGDIAVLTFDRPPLNAIDEQIVTELAAATEELAADASVRAVLVRSALEGVFMAGADITEFQRVTTEGLDRALLAQEVVTRFAELPQPTVAAINGHALGGGLEVALACDFRFCARAEGALIGLPEVRLGLLPGAGGTQRLTALVGPGRATELIMKGLQLSPEQAHADGIVHFLVEPGELDDQARDYTVRLARQAPIALRGIKRAIRAAGRRRALPSRARRSARCSPRRTRRPACTAFLEGEKATFSGDLKDADLRRYTFLPCASRRESPIPRTTCAGASRPARAASGGSRRLDRRRSRSCGRSRSRSSTRAHRGRSRRASRSTVSTSAGCRRGGDDDARAALAGERSRSRSTSSSTATVPRQGVASSA